MAFSETVFKPAVFTEVSHTEALWNGEGSDFNSYQDHTQLFVNGQDDSSSSSSSSSQRLSSSSCSSDLQTSEEIHIDKFVTQTQDTHDSGIDQDNQVGDKTSTNKSNPRNLLLDDFDLTIGMPENLREDYISEEDFSKKSPEYIAVYSSDSLSSATTSDCSPSGTVPCDMSQNSASVTKPSSDFWSQITASAEFPLISIPESDLPVCSSSLPRDWRQNVLRYPPCVVCSGKSSGLHYGCYTCEACKNFFRRYLLRSGGFTCKKNNNCVISNRSRGNCSGCRLKKCLDVGMSKEKSKIGRYTHSQRTETIREVNKLEGKAYEDELDIKKESDFEEVDNEDTQSGAVSHLSVGDTLTDEEKATVNTLVEMMDAIEHFGEKGKTAEGIAEIIQEHYEKYLAKVKLIGPLKAIPKDEYFTLLKLYNIDLDGRWTLFKQEANNCAHIVERYCKFAYRIPGWHTISIKDQEILLKIGHCDFFIILMHEGYDHERQIFLEMNGVPAHVEEAADKIFSRDLIEQQCKLFYKWQQTNLNKEEQALLCAMSLLCSDRVKLENPEAVEKIHAELTDILMKVLKKYHGKNADKRFSKFIDNLTFCRQASEAYFREYQEMSNDDLVQEVAPAFPTLCPDTF